MKTHEVAGIGCLIVLAPIWLPVALAVALFFFGVIVPLRLLLAVPGFTIGWMATGEWDQKAFKEFVLWDD